MSCLLSIFSSFVYLITSFFVVSIVVYIFGLIGWFSIVFFLVIYLVWYLIKSSNL